MLSKDKRLNLKLLFNFVIKGQKFENPTAKFFFRFGDPSASSGQVTQPKVGVALKKEYFRLATERNRARRLVSKGFENLYDKLPKGINIVAMPKSGILSLSSDGVTESLEEMLRKTNLLKDRS